ncbi:MAG: hypothetical protein AAF333_13265 [Planctomycetota bacterium]
MSENPSKHNENAAWAIRKGGFGNAVYGDGDVEAVRFAGDPVFVGEVTHVEHVDAEDVPVDALLFDGAMKLARIAPNGLVELIHLAATPMLFVRCDLLRKNEGEDGARQDIPTHMIQPPPPVPPETPEAPSRDHPVPHVTPGNGAPQS